MSWIIHLFHSHEWKAFHQPQWGLTQTLRADASTLSHTEWCFTLDVAPSSLAASAFSSPVQPLACSFSYKGCHKQRQAASTLSSSMMLFLVSSAETSHQTLQNRRQQVKESLWAACHIHLLEFCLHFQMVLSRKLAPSCHPSKPFEKDLHFLLGALVLCSFIEESFNSSV